MKKFRHGNMLTVCCWTFTVLALILFYGCSGAIRTTTMEQVPAVASDTITEEWQLVENPDTGLMEMQLVHRVRTTVSTSSSSSTENEGQQYHYPPNNDTARWVLAISSLALALVALSLSLSE